MTTEEFWIVWSPTGETPPKYRHYSSESAATEATELAEAA